MLTIQSAILLYKLNQVDNPYVFDTNDLENQALIVNYKTLKFVKSSYYTYDKSSSLVVRLDELEYLKENSYIKIGDSFITFTHKGYRYFQIPFLKFLSFLGNSIITPIAVTILTNLVINHLK